MNLDEEFLSIQSHDIYWRKFTLRTPTNNYSYLLGDKVRGKITKPPKAGSSYQFGIQIGQNTTVMLQLHGVPSSCLPIDIEMCENTLLDPIIIEVGDSKLCMVLCGINTISDILNIVGRGLKIMTPRKAKTKASKKKVPARAR